MNLAHQMYQTVNVESDILSASPHRVVQLMFAGAIEQLSLAAQHLKNDDMAAKGVALSKAMDIISALQNNLDMEKGENIAEELDALYSFMLRHLLQANIENDLTAIDDVKYLVETIKKGWDGIA